MADTQPLAPTDAEIDAMAEQYLLRMFGSRVVFNGTMIDFARAVLAKWGAQPVPASAAEFALQALVAAGHVSQELVNQAMALPGAPARPVVPAGYALVPVEPTPEMLAEVDEEVGGHCHSCTRWKASYDDCQRIWAAMLAAAPQPVVREPRYRLLEPGIDRIEADDEFLMDDTKTWETDAGGIFVGTLYGNVFRPARRAIT